MSYLICSHPLSVCLCLHSPFSALCSLSLLSVLAVGLSMLLLRSLLSVLICHFSFLNSPPAPPLRTVTETDRERGVLKGPRSYLGRKKMLPACRRFLHSLFAQPCTAQLCVRKCKAYFVSLTAAAVAVARQGSRHHSKAVLKAGSEAHMDGK